MPCQPSQPNVAWRSDLHRSGGQGDTINKLTAWRPENPTHLITQPHVRAHTCTRIVVSIGRRRYAQYRVLIDEAMIGSRKDRDEGRRVLSSKCLGYKARARTHTHTHVHKEPARTAQRGEFFVFCFLFLGEVNMPRAIALRRPVAQPA